MDRSLSFYRDGLGFSVTNSAGPEGRLTWAFLENGPVSLMLSTGSAYSLPHDEDEDHIHSEWSGPQRPSGIDINDVTWFYVPDVDEVHAHLSRSGFDVVDSPAPKGYGLRDFLVRDPDGYHYAIGTPLRG
jgi:catechol 2,3-dioxygenase-like lactoylglutathione lyase family enzyme